MSGFRMAPEHIVCVGAVYIDTVLDVPQYPVEDQKLRATSHTRRRGGNCANTLEVLSQLVFQDARPDSDSSEAPAGDTQLHLLTVLPNKQCGSTDLIRKSLPNVKMNRSCIFRAEHTKAAASYILRNAQNNSRTIISHNPLPEMTVQEFVAKVYLLTQMEVASQWRFHFEGRIPEVTLQCVEYLRSFKEQRIFISVECEKPEREQMHEVAKQADVVFYSRLWAQTKGYDDPRKFLLAQIEEMRPDALLCCTWGEKGAVAVAKSPLQPPLWISVSEWHPSIGSSEVIDTIGAGDTFIAGMLYALSKHEYDWLLRDKVEFANELAGRKVIRHGFQGIWRDLDL